MNISELARQLRVPTEELRSMLPTLGFDIGGKAIKIPDRDVGKIRNAWQEHKKRLYLQKKMEEQKSRAERKARVLSGDAEKVAIPALITVRDFATLLNHAITVRHAVPHPQLVLTPGVLLASKRDPRRWSPTLGKYPSSRPPSSAHADRRSTCFYREIYF